MNEKIFTRLFRKQERTYYKFAGFRDKNFRYLPKILSFLKLTPDMLTLTGFILMLLFIVFIKINIYFSGGLLLLTLLIDSLDGVLARYQKVDSDKGKFKDRICDNVNFSLFVIGLVYAGFLSGLIGLIYVYSMILSQIFRSIHNAFLVKSDWHFRATAGFLPTLFVGISYGLFIVFLVVFNKNYLYSTSLIFSIILIIDAIIFFRQIIKK